MFLPWLNQGFGYSEERAVTWKSVTSNDYIMLLLFALLIVSIIVKFTTTYNQRRMFKFLIIVYTRGFHREGQNVKSK